LQEKQYSDYGQWRPHQRKANPDKRVERIRDYALAKFGTTKVLDFALGVEVVTTDKRANLILNVDGCIAVCCIAYF